MSGSNVPTSDSDSARLRAGAREAARIGQKIKEARDRHPGWFPERPCELFVDTAPGRSPHQRQLVDAGIRAHMEHLLEHHDLRRRGADNLASWFERSLLALGEEILSYGATVITVTTAGRLQTTVVISEIGPGRPKEDSRAWQVRFASPTAPTTDRGADWGKCDNARCPMMAAGVERCWLKRCKRCGRARYCTRACQTEDWKTHKPDCKPV